MSITFGGGGGSHLSRTEYVYSPVRNARHGGGNNPFAGVIPGLALVTLSSAVLWWNEGRSARTDRMLAAAKQALTPLDGTEAPSAESIGGLVHLSGLLSTKGVHDELFGEVHRPDSLRRCSERGNPEPPRHLCQRRLRRLVLQTVLALWAADCCD